MEQRQGHTTKPTQTENRKQILISIKQYYCIIIIKNLLKWCTFNIILYLVIYDVFRTHNWSLRSTKSLQDMTG